jgi:hypothetical protein
MLQASNAVETTHRQYFKVQEKIFKRNKTVAKAHTAFAEADSKKDMLMAMQSYIMPMPMPHHRDTSSLQIHIGQDHDPRVIAGVVQEALEAYAARNKPSPPTEFAKNATTAEGIPGQAIR